MWLKQILSLSHHYNSHIAIHSFHKGNDPSLEVSNSLTMKLVVNLLAFSGATPINWDNTPNNKETMYTVLFSILDNSTTSLQRTLLDVLL